MSATIMMPQQIDVAIREMCTDAMSQAVAALADKYGFDAEEANRFLAADTLKIVRKRGPAAASKDEKPKSPPAKSKNEKSDKPKRAKTGYLLYADEVRAEVKASLTAGLEEGEKLKPQDVVKGIASLWKGVDQEVRDEWNAKAKTPATSDDEVEVVMAELVAEVVPAKTAPAKPKKERKSTKPVAIVVAEDDADLTDNE